MANEEEDILCIICWNEVINLVTAECGHAICMSCFKKKSSPFSCCTSCWEYSQLRTSQVDIVMHPEGEGICEIHREDQKLFCDGTKTLLCVTCSKSEYHEIHTHWPIAVAALRYRKKIEEMMEILCTKIKIREQFLLYEKERPLIWTVIYNNDTNTERQTDHKELQPTCEYMKKKKATDEELIVEDGNKKFNELYQRLKEIEATQEHEIMEQKKEWEAMMSSHIRSLTDIKTELEEKMQKPDIEMLQDVAETLARYVSRYKY
ncbi:tripartite motif-containing protein 43-like [Dromiciops gliroides]|uniref:tripartite motif-containing protein 43-like n=1 Tax=Dromiciops gliroides TaxID=33562 RepID=UPI001CC664AD|nr:tripartite motif-containing protein 43-like [Dromiciops gliroides]